MKKQTKALFCEPGENTKVHPALKEYFGYCFHKAAIRLRFMMNEALESHGIIPLQLGILRILEKLGPLSQIEIGESMAIDKASMVKFIDGLEALKLVTRITSKEDRRVKFIKITTSGLKLLTKTSQLRQKVELEFLKPLSPDEKKILTEVIHKLV